MLNKREQQSIFRRIRAIALIVSALSVSLPIVVFFLTTIHTYYKNTKTELLLLSSLSAESLSVVLLDDNKPALQQALTALVANSSVQFAAIYSPDDTLIISAGQLTEDEVTLLSSGDAQTYLSNSLFYNRQSIVANKQ